MSDGGPSAVGKTIAGEVHCSADQYYCREQQEDLELWQHHATSGGEDKSRMVTVGTWLLGASAAILWYFATNLQTQTKSRPQLQLQSPLRMATIAFLGVGISVAAGIVVLVYGGYANRNWKEADDIACRRGWLDLLPTADDTPQKHEHADLEKRHGDAQEAASRSTQPAAFKGLRYRLNGWAWRLAKPKNPENIMAPVFHIFFFFALMLLLAHLGILAWSLFSL
jgi:hypothetical protein